MTHPGLLTCTSNESISIVITVKLLHVLFQMTQSRPFYCAILHNSLCRNSQLHINLNPVIFFE